MSGGREEWILGEVQHGAVRNLARASSKAIVMYNPLIPRRNVRKYRKSLF